MLLRLRTTGLSPLLALFVLLVAGCGSDSPMDSADPSEPDDSACACRGRGAVVNHLSQPVLWSDGYALPLPGVHGDERFDGAATDADGDLWYHQRDANNEWRAESIEGDGSPVDVTFIDWGDNLEAKPWFENSMVRVEIVLVQELPFTLTAYEMHYLDGRGPTEVWGTNGVTYESSEATVYSHSARLVIQKLPAGHGPGDFAWDAEACAWIGADAPLLSSGVWTSAEGPSAGLSVEVNVAGRLIYGHNWDLRENGEGPGLYRITFALDGAHGDAPLHTFFETTQVRLAGPPPEEDHGGGVAIVDPANNLSYMDVKIVPRSGEGGGGGNGGGGGDGCGGDGDGEAGARNATSPLRVSAVER